MERSVRLNAQDRLLVVRGRRLARGKRIDGVRTRKIDIDVFAKEREPLDLVNRISLALVNRLEACRDDARTELALDDRTLRGIVVRRRLRAVKRPPGLFLVKLRRLGSQYHYKTHLTRRKSGQFLVLDADRELALVIFIAARVGLLARDSRQQVEIELAQVCRVRDGVHRRGRTRQVEVAAISVHEAGVVHILRLAVGNVVPDETVLHRASVLPDTAVCSRGLVAHDCAVSNDARALDRDATAVAVHEVVRDERVEHRTRVQVDAAALAGRTRGDLIADDAAALHERTRPRNRQGTAVLCAAARALRPVVREDAVDERTALHAAAGAGDRNAHSRVVANDAIGDRAARLSDLQATPLVRLLAGRRIGSVNHDAGNHRLGVRKHQDRRTRRLGGRIEDNAPESVLGHERHPLVHDKRVRHNIEAALDMDDGAICRRGKRCFKRLRTRREGIIGILVPPVLRHVDVAREHLDCRRLHRGSGITRNVLDRERHVVAPDRHFDDQRRQVVAAPHRIHAILVGQRPRVDQAFEVGTHHTRVEGQRIRAEFPDGLDIKTDREPRHLELVAAHVRTVPCNALVARKVGDVVHPLEVERRVDRARKPNRVVAVHGVRERRIGRDAVRPKRWRRAVVRGIFQV